MPTRRSKSCNGLLTLTLLTWMGLADYAIAPIKSIVFYVSTEGNDAWSGTQPEPAGSDGPFATLQRARDAIRQLRSKHAGNLIGPVAVYVRGGTYYLDNPLTFTHQDSGAAESPVTFTAYRDERPIVSGGRRITGWKPANVNGRPLWAAEIPQVREGQWYFHQLWVNGERRVRARHPNEGFLHVVRLIDTTPPNRGFEFSPGDLREWEDLKDVDVVVLHLWVDVRFAIARVDETQHIVLFTQSSRRRLSDGSRPTRYYVENAFELLDAPGEWYLNRKTGMLYYWPMPGEKMADAEVIAPALTELVRLEGRPEAGETIEHLVFRGLTFSHSDWWLPRDDPGDLQAAVSVPGAIYGNGVRHCVFEGCSVAHMSNYAIDLARGCQGNRIVGCDLFDLGAGGVKIGETAIRDAASEQTHHNEITDNRIHDGGHAFHQGVGLWIGQSYGNRIARNDVYDFYYTGISVGWTWGYGRTLARDNVIELNHAHDIGKAWLSDMGGIYTLGTQPGTVIRSNVFHDIAAYSYGGWGIYFDEGTTNVLAEGNLVYRTTHGGFHQHYGRENVVRNNVFAFGRDAQIQRTRQEPHRSFTFERNIVYWRSGNLLAGSWSNFNFAFDRNLYWRADGGAIRFGNLTWDQWRAQGMDPNSMIADPLFVNPEGDDFCLKPDSPAFKLGFVPLDVCQTGPRK